MIKDVCNVNPIFRCIILRYFNPVGAHESGLIGEDPNGIPNNLMPFISRVAIGKLHQLNIFGNDYDTKDGTCIRDYIHVCDLAEAHMVALDKIQSVNNYDIYNIGRGEGVSVLEMVNAYNDVCGNKVKYSFDKRRKGDIAECYACCIKAQNELGWKAKYDLKKMCESSYKFELENQNYNKKA